MLAKGNAKLGKDVFTFGVPAKQTCPGSTESCRAVCYAANGRYRTDRVKRRLKASLAASKKKMFPEVMAAAVEISGAATVRVHDAGDFYNEGYARKWLAVMRACPQVTFYGYTRSFRTPSVRRVLVKMAALPNVRLWFSCDKDTGVPARVPKNVRVAYLQTEAGEGVPKADLVFRVRKLRKTPARTVPTADGVAKVCPTETGLPSAHDASCSKCRYCWEAPPAEGRTPLEVLR